MHSEQTIVLQICFKQTYLSKSSQTFRVLHFTEKSARKIFEFVEKARKSILTIRLQSSRFSKKLYCSYDTIIMFINYIISVSLKMKFEIRKWTPYPAPCAPDMCSFSDNKKEFTSIDEILKFYLTN